MNFNNTWNNNTGNDPVAIADAPGAAGVEIVAAEEPTRLLAPASSADAAESGSGGLWLQNVFGGGVELSMSMSMRNDESVEESSTASTRSLGTASFLSNSKNKKIIFFALTGLFAVAVVIGASQVANKRTISSAAASAAKTPKFSKEPKTGSKTPKVTKAPKTAVPSFMPSDSPSTYPSDLPSSSPSLMPSDSPSVSVAPSEGPSAQPSSLPSASPSLQPSSTPSSMPSESPSDVPSSMPSETPSSMPSESPSDVPSSMPSSSPSLQPSSSPSSSPSEEPSESPSLQPSSTPSSSPSEEPSAQPSSLPSASPSLKPSSSPSVIPSDVPSGSPSKDCSSIDGVYTADEPVLPNGRIQRGKVPTCNKPKPFPGYKNCTGTCGYLTFGPFSGSGNPDGCLQIELDRGTCVKWNNANKSIVFLTAYNQPFDENDLQAGYLGDQGSLFSSSFQVLYTSDDPIYIMAQADSRPCNFSFSLLWGECDSSIESSVSSIFNELV